MSDMWGIKIEPFGSTFPLAPHEMVSSMFPGSALAGVTPSHSSPSRDGPAMRQIPLAGEAGKWQRRWRFCSEGWFMNLMVVG
jgi:hypothetical protein